jgi:hypothetical protein
VDNFFTNASGHPVFTNLQSRTGSGLDTSGSGFCAFGSGFFVPGGTLSNIGLGLLINR